MPVVSDFTALLSGDYWTGIERTNTPVFVTYSFPSSSPASHTAVPGIDVSSFQAFTETQKAEAVAALQQWGNASGIVFLEVPPGEGQINFALYDFPGASGLGSGGMAFNPFGNWNYLSFAGSNQEVFLDDQGSGVLDFSGDVFINKSLLTGPNFNIPTGLLLHEIGHALGLKHVNATFPGDTSYITFSGTLTHDESLTLALDDTANTVMSYNGAEPLTLGSLDIQAIQHIYGTNAQDGSQVASYAWNGATFELTQTGFDGVDDIMRGISVRDIMSGGTGNDRLFGLGGDDSLDGGAGTDELWGGFGNDTMAGGSGADTFFASPFDTSAAQSDTITDFNAAEDVLDLQLFGNLNFLGPASYETLQNYVLTLSGGNATLSAFWNGFEQKITLANYTGTLTAANFNLVSFFPRTTVGTDNKDTLFGSLSNDDLNGGGGSDAILGDAGNDTITGGLGADTLAGGGDDDIFIAAAGDIVSGESIDGGAGTADELRLGTGAHSLVGVTLTGVEKITLSATGTNTLTLGDASQAALVTAAPGSNDTVILDGYLTWPQQQALAAAGVENVQFTNANGTNVVHFAGGVLSSVDVTYLPSNTQFQNATLTYNTTTGALISTRTLFDNGVEETLTLTAAGLKLTVHKVDTLDAFSWSEQLYTYAANGTSLATLLQTNDPEIGGTQLYEYTNGVITRTQATEADGDTYDVRYTNSGALLSTELTDVSHTAASYNSIKKDYVAGALVKSTVVQDNGERVVTNYSGGVKTSTEQYDDGNLFSYASVVKLFTPGGQVASSIHTMDNGTRAHYSGALGATLTGNGANESFTGAAGAVDTFVFGPLGGNDYIANFENGTDRIDLSAYHFANFGAVNALAVGGLTSLHLYFADGGHLTINGLAKATFDASDIIL